jgi:hypothetical protein
MRRIQMQKTMCLIGVVLLMAACSNPLFPPKPVWELTDLKVTRLPDKTVYAKGEELDITGLEVNGIYYDGALTKESPEEITLDNINGYDKNLQDTQVITVTVQEQQTSFEIIVEGNRQIIINLDDPVNGIPDSITVFRSEEIKWTLARDYVEYAWFVNGNLVSNEKDFILKAKGLPLKSNNLLVEVKTDTGTFYGKELAFTVAK